MLILPILFIFSFSISCIKNPFTQKTAATPTEGPNARQTSTPAGDSTNIFKIPEIYMGSIVANGVIENKKIIFQPKIEKFGGSSGTITPFTNTTFWKCQKGDKDLSKEVCDKRLSQWIEEVSKKDNKGVNFNLNFTIQKQENNHWQQKLILTKFSELLNPIKFIFNLGVPLENATLVVRQSNLTNETLEVPLKFDLNDNTQVQILKKMLALYVGPFPKDTSELIQALEHRDVYETVLLSTAAAATGAAGALVLVKGGPAGGRFVTNLYKKGVDTKFGSQLRELFENKLPMGGVRMVAHAQSIQSLHGVEEFSKFRNVLKSIESAYVQDGRVMDYENVAPHLRNALMDSFSRGWRLTELEITGTSGVPTKYVSMGRYRGLVRFEIPSVEVEFATVNRARSAPVGIITQWPQNHKEAEDVMAAILEAHKTLGRTPEPKALIEVKRYLGLS